LPPSQGQRGRPQNILAVFNDVLDPEIRDVNRIEQLIEESLGQIFNIFPERGKRRLLYRERHSGYREMK